MEKCSQKDKKNIWNIGRPVSRIHPIIAVIRKIQAINYNSDFYKIGMYNKEKLTNHRVAKVKFSAVLNKVDFQRKCDGTSDCEIWNKIEIPNTPKNNQYIKYVGIQFIKNNHLEIISKIVSSIYNIILFALVLSLLCSFILSRSLTKSIYKILGSLKS